MSVERDAGVAAFEQGEIATAISQLEAATRQDPRDFQAHLYLGAAYGQAERHMDAVNMLTQAVTIEPANAKARYNLGVAMEKAGYKEQAIAVLQQAILLQPDYAKAQEALQRLTGAPAPPPAQTAAPMASGAASGYGQPALTEQPTTFIGAQNATPVETGSPLPTNRPWPGQAGQPAQNPTPNPYPPQQGYGQQPYPAQQAYPAATQQPYQPQGAASYGGPPVNAYQQPYGMAMTQNSSGMKSDVPAEVQNMGWNWGAMGLHWIWLCGHNMVGAGLGLFFGVIFIGFLSMFAPGSILLVMALMLGISIYLGVNGNKLAWQNRRFDSIDQFREVRSAWNAWGIAFFIIGMIGLAIFAFFVIVGLMALASIGASSGRSSF